MKKLLSGIWLMACIALCGYAQAEDKFEIVPFTTGEELAIENISVSVYPGTAEFGLIKAGTKIQMKLNGTALTDENGMASDCSFSKVTILPHAVISLDWFLDRDATVEIPGAGRARIKGFRYDKTVATKDIKNDAEYKTNCFIFTGKEGATFEKKGNAFVLLKGKALLVKAVPPYTFKELLKMRQEVIK